MTKRLITAALVAVLSATAQAEQWLCKGDRVTNYRSATFGTAVDPVTFILEIAYGSERIAIKGDIGPIGIDNSNFWGGSVVFGDGYIARASDWQNTIRLNDYGDLTWTGSSHPAFIEVAFGKGSKL